MGINRKAFLKVVGGAAAYGLVGRAARLFAAGEDPADLVLTNGAIVTMNDARPVVSAMAVKAGRVVAVGEAEEVSGRIGPATKVIDLKGAGVSPGLIDAHSHLIGFGQMQLMYVILRPPKVASFDTLKGALAEAARAKPKGEWIVGRGFQEFKEGRFPRREELDEAVPDHPVLIIHWGGQFGVANTLALKKAGLLRKDAQDPYGGKFLRDPRTGLPDGVLIHYPAIYAVYQPLLSEEEQLKCARWALQQFASQGVTCIHDNFVHPKYAVAYVRLERSGELPTRVRVYPYVWNLKQAQELVGNLKRYVGPLVRLQGIKLAVDGYALMYDVPAERRELAIPMHPQEIFEEIIASIHRGGLQADVHAVGDKGVDWTLRAYARAAGGVAQARERRHRIEHFPFLKADSIRMAADMNVPVCAQPAFIDVRAEDMLKRLDPRMGERIETWVPLRSFAREGVRVAFGADVPAFPHSSPLESIRCAMERKTSGGRQLDMSEGISFMEALRAHTIGGAYASFDERELGSLEPGKAADFVVWNKDLRSVKTAQDVMALGVKATYLAGRSVYSG